jgi:hypothetical protein
LKDLLLDAELLQQLLVHLTAVGGAIRLQLRLIEPAELAGRDRLPLDLRDGIARCGVGAGAAEEVRDVEHHESQTHENQAPFQPVLVPAHPVEHRHQSTLKLSASNSQLPASILSISDFGRDRHPTERDASARLSCWPESPEQKADASRTSHGMP